MRKLVRWFEIGVLLLGLAVLPLQVGRVLAEPGVGRVVMVLPGQHGVHSTDLLLLAIVVPVWMGLCWRLWRRW